jgi:hypothetical protein
VPIRFVALLISRQPAAVVVFWLGRLPSPVPLPGDDRHHAGACRAGSGVSDAADWASACYPRDSRRYLRISTKTTFAGGVLGRRSVMWCVLVAKIVDKPQAVSPFSSNGIYLTRHVDILKIEEIAASSNSLRRIAAWRAFSTAI